LTLRLGAHWRTILAAWKHPDVSATSLVGYRVTSQIVGVGDCDAEYRGPTSSVVVERSATTLLIGNIIPWRRYRVTVSSLYDVGHADIFAEISSTDTGQLIARQTGGRRDVRATLCHRYEVIRSRDVIGYAIIRLRVDDFLYVLNRNQFFEIFSVKNYDVMTSSLTPGSTIRVDPIGTQHRRPLC